MCQRQSFTGPNATSQAFQSYLSITHLSHALSNIVQTYVLRATYPSYIAFTNITNVPYTNTTHSQATPFEATHKLGWVELTWDLAPELHVCVHMVDVQWGPSPEQVDVRMKITGWLDQQAAAEMAELKMDAVNKEALAYVDGVCVGCLGEVVDILDKIVP